MHGILYEYPRAERFFLHYPLPALYRSKFYSDCHCAANNQFHYPLFSRRYFDEYVQTGRPDHSKRKDYRKREFIGKRQFHDGSAAKIYDVASADGYEEV